jgi:hypothetical protein
MQGRRDMDKFEIDHRFTGKLLNICANRALIEDALDTRETILCAAELVRYIFDSNKSVVTLSKEIETANLYIDAFLTSENSSRTFSVIQSVSEAVYIDHMSLLSFVISDIENVISLSGSKKIIYDVVLSDDLNVLKKINGDVVLEYRISKR